MFDEQPDGDRMEVRPNSTASEVLRRAANIMHWRRRRGRSGRSMGQRVQQTAG